MWGKKKNKHEVHVHWSSIVKDAAVYVPSTSTHKHTHLAGLRLPWGQNELEDKKENTRSGIGWESIWNERFWFESFIFIATPLIYIVLLLLGGSRKHTCIHFLCCIKPSSFNSGIKSGIKSHIKYIFLWSDHIWDVEVDISLIDCL